MKIILTLTFIFSAQSVFAYDVDTHFYGTYSMARFAGIKHEVAAKLATSAQWMDESYLSDPTSIIFLPLTGVKKRRLLHFPSSRTSGAAVANTQHEAVGIKELSPLEKKIADALMDYADVDIDVTTLNLLSNTVEGHAFATELLTEGLKEGNLMKCGASLHTLEDSYAHAGTPAGQGHATFWHWPDRPFSDPDKYSRMVHSMFAALVAIRGQLPVSAVDCNLRTDLTQQNCGMTYGQLSKAYMALPDVAQTIAYDVLKDPVYVKSALDDFFRRATRANYMNISQEKFDQLINSMQLVDGKKDAYEALEILLQKFIEDLLATNESGLNLSYVLKDMGVFNINVSTQTIAKYMQSFSLDNESQNLGPVSYSPFIKSMVNDLLKWAVPRELDKSHRVELENDNSGTRQKEMELRNANMQNLISKLFNINIQFVPNNTASEVGFAYEVWKDAKANSLVPKDNAAIYVTFNLEEKHAFNNMIFQYLYPSLGPQELVNMVNFGAKLKLHQNRLAEYLTERKKINDSDSYYVTKKSKLIALDFSYSDVLGDIPSILSDANDFFADGTAKKFLHDLFSSHLEPSYDSMFYRSAKLRREMERQGMLKQFLKDGRDFWTESSLNLNP